MAKAAKKAAKPELISVEVVSHELEDQGERRRLELARRRCDEHGRVLQEGASHEVGPGTGHLGGHDPAQ